MKKMLLAVVIVIFIGSFFGCATRYPMTGPDHLKGWSQFVGEPVVSVRDIYPDGDVVPRNYIRTKSGAIRIY